MKACIKNPNLLLVLIAGLVLMSVGRVMAQTFTTLHHFTETFYTENSATNYDGANPLAGLILSGHTLYGTASDGGIEGFGSVFAVNTDGTGFTNLYRSHLINTSTG